MMVCGSIVSEQVESIQLLIARKISGVIGYPQVRYGRSQFRPTPAQDENAQHRQRRTKSARLNCT